MTNATRAPDQAGDGRAQRSPRVRLNPPPRRLMRTINPLIRRVLASRRLGGATKAMIVLQFSGRRTGRLIRVPVALHMIDGVPMAFTHRPWRLNFIGGAPVSITHRGQVHDGRATLLDASPAQVGAALRKALDSGTSPFVLGVKIARSCDPTIEDLAAVGLSLIQLELDTTTWPRPDAVRRLA